MENIVDSHFQGTKWTLCDNWFSSLNVDDYKDRPIKYLEIGTLYGANLLAVANTYGLHAKSRLYCIDPWEDYDSYSEYKSQQNNIYQTFCDNIVNSENMKKFVVQRGYSNNIVPKMEDDFFDIIYVDGNHNVEYVLEDAVMSIRKLKSGGILIFDDYCDGWPETKQAVDAFFSCYKRKIEHIATPGTQIIFKKL